MLNIRLIGPCCISDSAADLKLPHSRKTLALLGYLLASGKTRRRDFLCELFWQQVDDPKGALRWSLSKLRDILDSGGKKRVESNRESVSISTEDCSVDLLTIEEAIRSNVQELSNAEIIELNNILKGEFLANLDLPDCESYQFWLIGKRENLRAFRVRLLQILISRTEEIEIRLSYTQQLNELRPTAELDVLIRKMQQSRRTDVRDLGWKDVKSSLLLLPFTLVGSNSDARNVALELKETISTRLARNNKFSMVSNIEIPTGKSPEAVAAENGIRYLVKGNLSRQEKLQITVQLVETIKNQNLWGEIFVVDENELWGLTAGKIASDIYAEIVSAEFTRVNQKEDKELNGWDFHIKALYHLTKVTEKDLLESRRLALNAIERDTDIADAHAILSATYVYDAMYGWGSSYEEAVEKAASAAERAIRTDPSDPSAVRSMGLALLHSREHSTAVKYFERACELAPFEAENHALLGWCHGLCCDYVNAKEHLLNALSLGVREYFRATWCNHLAMCAALGEQFEDCIEWSEKALSLNPDFPGAYRSLVVGHIGLKNHEKARKTLKKLLTLLPNLTVAEVRMRIPFGEKKSQEKYLSMLKEAGLHI